MQTQWHVGINGRTGLNYQAIEPVCKMLGVELSADEYRLLTACERHALEIWQQQS